MKTNILAGLVVMGLGLAVVFGQERAHAEPPIPPLPGPVPRIPPGSSPPQNPTFYPMIAGASYEVEVHPIATLRAVLDIVDTNANAARAATEAITIALIQDGWEQDSGHLLQSGKGDAARYTVQGVWRGAASLNSISLSGILTYDQPKRTA